jgi:hypothetical protein
MRFVGSLESNAGAIFVTGFDISGVRTFVIILYSHDNSSIESSGLAIFFIYVFFLIYGGHSISVSIVNNGKGVLLFEYELDIL